MQQADNRGLGLRVAAFAVTALLAFADLFLGVGTNYAGLLICAICMTVLFFPYRRTPLGAVLLFAGASLYFTPLLALIYVEAQPLNVAFFALYIIIGVAFLRFGINEDDTDRGAPRAAPPLSSGPMDIVAVPILLAVGLLGTSLGLPPLIAGVVFFASWGMSLVHMERLMRSRNNPSAGWLVGAFILIFLLIFSMFFWDGFGRLILISLALGPVFIATRFTRFQIPSLFLAGMGVALVFVGRIIRFGANEGIVGIVEDSGTSHLLFSSELWQVSSLTQWITSFWEQFILLYFNWVPRDIWPGKPLGVNLTFVDVYMGRDGISEEHSTAIGYFGELIYYSPTFWPLLAVIVTAAIIFTRRGIAYLSGSFTTGTMLFDLWMITLFWGGMASFGARVWLALVPALAYMVFLRSIDRSRTMSLSVHNAPGYGSAARVGSGTRQ